MTRDWTNGASWNTYDGTNAWTTPGGDFDATPAATATVPAHHGGWTDWSATALVQHWVDGSLPNYGVAIQDKPGPQITGEEDYYSTEGTIPAQAPELDIVWTPRTGKPDFYTFESQALDTKATAGVNAANGNLLLATNDINSPGTGLDLKLDHYHNSLADPAELSALGIRGTASLGRDVHLHAYDAQTIGFSRGDGVTLPFLGATTTGTTTSWGAPAELADATLSKSSTTNQYTLHLPAGLPAWPGTGLTLTFDADGKLLGVKSAAGNTIALSYYAPGAMEYPALSGITDTNSAFWDVDRAYIGDERIVDITHPNNQHTVFGYLNTYDDYLTKVTAADNTTNKYAYDTSHRLKSITTPDGNVTLVTYNSTSSKVASIIRTNNPSHTTGPTTTFTYSSPTAPCQSTNFDFAKTVVQRPDSTGTTYCANDHAQITYDTDNPTTATPSGQWYDLRDQYTQGTGTHSITFTGADAAAGVKKMALGEVGGAEIAASTLPCDPRNATNPIACPHTATTTVSFSPSGVAEGARTFRQITTDYAGNAKASGTWVVKVDRTAPSVPTGFEQSLFDQSDPDHLVTLTWPESADPDLPGAVPGSGVGGYLVRYSLNGGAMSAWQPGDGPNVEVGGVSVGSTVAVEAKALDSVGNTSSAGSATITIAAKNEDPAVEEMAAEAYVAKHGGSMTVARAWMAVGSRARGIGEDIHASSSGSGYGGAWFDNSARKLVVNLKTGTSSAGAQSVLSAAGVTGDSRIEHVTYTQQELDDAYPGVATALDDLISASLIQLSRDDVNNALAIEVGTDTPSTERARINAAAASAPVLVTVTDSSDPNFAIDDESCVVRKLTNLTDHKWPVCDDPLRGGILANGFSANLQSSNGSCTLGFNSRSRSNQAFYVMTAGHCFDGYANDDSRWFSWLSDGTPHEIGHNHNPYVFGKDGDAGLITVDPNSDWVLLNPPRNWVFIQAHAGQTRRTSQYRITRVDYSALGDTICVSGAYSGGHCGEVIKTGASAKGNDYYGIVDTCGTHGGDSGAGFVRAGSARGLLKGSAAIRPCHIYFQSAKRAENQLNVDIMTHAP